MTNEEFKQSLTTSKTFKDVEKEKEYLFEIIQYWLKEYSPGVHLSIQALTGELISIGWLKDIQLKHGGKQELKLLRKAFESIKKSSIFDP